MMTSKKVSIFGRRRCSAEVHRKICRGSYKILLRFIWNFAKVQIKFCRGSYKILKRFIENFAAVKAQVRLKANDHHGIMELWLRYWHECVELTRLWLRRLALVMYAIWILYVYYIIVINVYKEVMYKYQNTGKIVIRIIIEHYQWGLIKPPLPLCQDNSDDSNWNGLKSQIRRWSY